MRPPRLPFITRFSIKSISFNILSAISVYGCLNLLPSHSEYYKETNFDTDPKIAIPTFLSLPHILGVFYAKSLATRPLVSRVDFYRDESSRLESTRLESPTFLTLPHVLGVFYAKSLATRLPISRVDFYQDES